MRPRLKVDRSRWPLHLHLPDLLRLRTDGKNGVCDDLYERIGRCTFAVYAQHSSDNGPFSEC